MFKIWNFKIVLIILCICIFTSVSCVCASDINETFGPPAFNDYWDIDVYNTVDQLKSTDDVKGSFDDLEYDLGSLSPGDTYNMDKDYYYQDNGHTKDGIVIYIDNITINGNGHIINGNNKSALFYVYSNNVKIFNITFMNSFYSFTETKIATYSYESDRSPVLWIGDNGIISNCKFFGNSAPKMGGAITLNANNCVINNSLFINNTAGIIGGAIYIAGSNNIITNCMFLNSTSQIGGESIYVDKNHKNCKVSAITDGKRLVTDGSVSGIDLNYLNYIYESSFARQTLNIVPLIYL